MISMSWGQLQIHLPGTPCPCIFKAQNSSSTTYVNYQPFPAGAPPAHPHRSLCNEFCWSSRLRTSNKGKKAAMGWFKSHLASQLCQTCSPWFTLLHRTIWVLYNFWSVICTVSSRSTCRVVDNHLHYPSNPDRLLPTSRQTSSNASSMGGINAWKSSHFECSHW